MFGLACPMFLGSVTFYFYVKIKLKPKEDGELDDYYYEFEGQHPDLAKYYRMHSLAMTLVVVSMLMMFVAVVPF